MKHLEFLVFDFAFKIPQSEFRKKGRHSRESGNPGKHWIPGQARNDKLSKTYVVMCGRSDISRAR